MKRLIKNHKSIILACDVSNLLSLKSLIKRVDNLEGIGGYKIGLELALKNGLAQVVKTIRSISRKPIIYDHQKGATDIPELGGKFAKVVSQAGLKAVILFPLVGAKTEEVWIKACQREGLHVLVGAHMTHEKFLEKEGGFIDNNAPEKIFTLAAKNGIWDFVVPGNKAELVKKYKRLLEKLLGKDKFVLYAPGFISQGGKVSETGRIAGKFWHAIVGRAIYEAANPKETAQKLCQQINKKT